MLCFVFALILGFRSFGQTGNEKPNPQSQSEAASFNVRVDVDLVTTDVTVVGTAVPEFMPEDFVIYDNDVAQQISYFSHDQLPIAIALLIDSSGSIENHLNELQLSALAALRRLKPGDQVALYAFAQKYRKLSDITEDRLHIAELISHLKTEPGTDIIGTLQDAVHYLKKAAPRRRRAIILISDNCHVNGKFNTDQIQADLLENATTLYNVVTPSTDTDSPGCLLTNSAIQGIAVASGGEVMNVRSSTSLKGALEAAISRIRMRYTLGFNPSNPGPRGSYHKVKIRFANRDRCPGCGIIGRSGYYSDVTAPIALPEQGLLALDASPRSSDPSLVQRIILTAGTSSRDFNEISFTFSATEQIVSSGKTEIQVNLRIDFSGIDIPRAVGRRAYIVDAAILQIDEKGNIQGHGFWKLEDFLDEQDYRHIATQGIRFNTTVALEPRSQFLKIVIYDESSGRISSGYVWGPSSHRPVH